MPVVSSGSKPSAPAPTDAFPCGDEAVRRASGQDWAEWLRRLDGEGLAARCAAHDEVWRCVKGLQPGLDDWWAQMISVGYERARGLRARNQNCHGEFQASVSRTLAVPLDRAYAAFAERAAEWLEAPGLVVTKANPGKNLRARWTQGGRVEVRFTAKGEAKCQIVVDTTQLESAEDVAAAKAFWQARFTMLEAFLAASMSDATTTGAGEASASAMDEAAPSARNGAP